jgi:predicted O-methyltransferase YrrM
MRRFILDTLRRIAGTGQLIRDTEDLRAELDALRRETAGLREAMARAQATADATLAAIKPPLPQLPGTPYATLALPLEYPPSRDLRPRWGGTQPPLGPIVDWIRPHEADYRAVLAAMKTRAPALSRIARDFDPARLPEPAWRGVAIAPFDTAALYTLVGERRPKLYLEIGSGITTAFAWRSVKDHGLATRIVSIDPEPRAAIDGICDEVIRAGLETCDLSVFDQLEAGDILFLDGSHRVFMNSDVTVFMLDVLPRLKPGVLVHVHDIHLPWDYPAMFAPWYWSEAYILAAYIIGAAERLRPVLPTTWICRDAAFADWFAAPPVDLGPDNATWRDGGSLWFEKRA